jgi:hypothetical protein
MSADYIVSNVDLGLSTNNLLGTKALPSYWTPVQVEKLLEAQAEITGDKARQETAQEMLDWLRDCDIWIGSVDLQALKAKWGVK